MIYIIAITDRFDTPIAIEPLHVTTMSVFFSLPVELIGNSCIRWCCLQVLQKGDFSCVNMKVRSDYTGGKFLFEWNPEDDTVTLLLRGMYYRVKLVKAGKNSTYRILNKRPKR